jgi:hypothetical protein
MRTFYLAFGTRQTLSAKLRWRDGLIAEGRKDEDLHANCMKIARKNYSLPMIARGYRETEPQINAD